MPCILDQILSHPQSPNFPQGKPLVVHLEKVTSNALRKYTGPERYRYIVETAALLHDIGKANPNFQEYIRQPYVFKNTQKFKDHAYISAVILLILLLNNLLEKNDNDYLIWIGIVIISKHHSNLPDLTKEPLHNESLKKVAKYFQEESETAEIFIKNANIILDHFKSRLPFLNSTLTMQDFSEEKIHRLNLIIPRIIKDYFNTEQKLEYFLISQYIFSCIIEGDKRDAGDNNVINTDKVFETFTPIYFDRKLKEYYQGNSKKAIAKESLNKIRTLIKDKCVQEVKKQLAKNERIFQIISPTGSGKTLTFLSVASEIKKHYQDKNYKVIYALPFLSITDQVTNICKQIFENDEYQDIIYRIDSASINNRSIKNNDEDNKINQQNQLNEAFAEDIFDHAFIITTFVKLFETLLSNKNKTLLRLNNFSNSIILIDEIQALPPRSYTFLIAYLSKFAELFDSYVVIGSATQPKFGFSKEQKYVNELTNVKLKDLFFSYKEPISLLPEYKDIYQDNNFNRYELNINLENRKIPDLVQDIFDHESSVMIVLNTKNSSNELYTELYNKSVSSHSIYLLNTLQTLRDRRNKLNEIKAKLVNNEKIILISTQLIEAGVDISFPIVYRDFAPLPSIIQVAGRCNRNFEKKNGSVYLINIISNSGKRYCELVYDKDLLQITEQVLQNLYTLKEKDLLPIQNAFFEKLNTILHFGKYKLIYTDQTNNEYFLDTAVFKFEYDKLSQFRLIDEENGERASFFIIKDEEDMKDWESYAALSNPNFYTKFSSKIKIEESRKIISDREIQVPISIYNDGSLNLKEIFDHNSILGVCPFDLREYISGYSVERGFNLNMYENDFII